MENGATSCFCAVYNCVPLIMYTYCYASVHILNLAEAVKWFVYRWWIGGLTTFCTVAAISLILNIFLLSRRIACLGRSQTKRTLPMRRTNIVYDAAPLVDDVSTSDMDSDEEYYRKTFAPSRVSDRVVQNDSYRPSGALGENVDSSDHGTDVAAISETLPMVEL